MLVKLEQRFGPAPVSPTSQENEEHSRSRFLTERSAAAAKAATAASTQLSSLMTDVSSASLALVANVGRRGSGNTEFGDMIRRRSSGGAGGAGTQQRDLAMIEAKMTDLYRVHLPSKVGDVPSLLEKYRGKEQEMLSKLEAKFGPAVLPEKPASPLAALFTPSVSEISTVDKKENLLDKLVDLSDLGGSVKEKEKPPPQSRFMGVDDPFAGLGTATLTRKNM